MYILCLFFSPRIARESDFMLRGSALFVVCALPLILVVEAVGLLFIADRRRGRAQPWLADIPFAPTGASFLRFAL